MPLDYGLRFDRGNLQVTDRLEPQVKATLQAGAHRGCATFYNLISYR